MRNSVADKLYKNNVFLVGDSAHQFPPSGGYGLNTGIFDVMNLSWRLSGGRPKCNSSSRAKHYLWS